MVAIPSGTSALVSADWAAWVRDLRANLTATPVGLVAALTLLGLAVRLIYLRMPMRQDESVTVTMFALAPWRETVGSYVFPNNHILHTIFAKLSLTIFGNGPWQARLPAFVFGVLIVPATWFVAQTSHSRTAASVATLGAAVLSPLVLFSDNARGYSIVVFFFLAQWLVARHAVRTDNLMSWFVLALLGALGLFTNPTMAYPYGAIILWVLYSLRSSGPEVNGRPVALAAAIAASAAMTLVLYAYTIRHSGWRAVFANDAVLPSSFSELPERFAKLSVLTAESWGTGFPAWLAIVLLAITAAGVVLGAFGKRRDAQILPAIAIVFGLGFMVASRRVPYYPRVFLYLMPLLLVAYGAVCQQTIARLPRRFVMAGWALAIAPFLFLGYRHVTARPVAEMTETGWFPDAAAVAEKLRTSLQPGDQIAGYWTEKDTVRYYLTLAGAGAPFHTSNGTVPTRRVFLIRGNNDLVVDVLEKEKLPRLWAPGFVVAASFPNSQLLVITFPPAAG